MLWDPLQKKEEQADGSISKTAEEHTDCFASWGEALGCGLKGISLKRLSKLYLLLRGGPGKGEGGLCSGIALLCLHGL